MNRARDSKGRAGEAALNEWLQTHGFSYVALCQSHETFAPLFRSSIKRPDFFVLLESVGLIAIDAKNYSYSGGVYTLELDSELRRAVAFERLFRIPLWYAYLDEREGRSSWYWISALKAVEVGEVRKKKADGKEFLALKRSEFEHLETGVDIAKLYKHRLPGVSKISALADL